jgi:hypothetical protein
VPKRLRRRYVTCACAHFHQVWQFSGSASACVYWCAPIFALPICVCAVAVVWARYFPRSLLASQPWQCVSVACQHRTAFRRFACARPLRPPPPPPYRRRHDHLHRRRRRHTHTHPLPPPPPPPTTCAQAMFVRGEHTVLRSKDWRAYPLYEAPEPLLPFAVEQPVEEEEDNEGDGGSGGNRGGGGGDGGSNRGSGTAAVAAAAATTRPRLFYASAYELASSAMEVGAIAGHNAASLVWHAFSRTDTAAFSSTTTAAADEATREL